MTLSSPFVLYLIYVEHITMKLKANLHFHSKEDPQDVLDHNLFDGVDKALELGFDVLAVTCHNKMVVRDHHKRYASEKGLLLIPGIELDVYEKWTKKRNHVVILNCDRLVEKVRTFEDLRRYKAAHPDIFIIAPHPFFFGYISLGKYLIEYIDLFDAIELSWFYTLWNNPNVKAAKVAEKYSKPFVATSDTHYLRFMHTSFTTIDAEEKTIPSVFKAMRNFDYENTTSPRPLFEILFIFGYHELRSTIKRILRDFRIFLHGKRKVITSYRDETQH